MSLEKQEYKTLEIEFERGGEKIFLKAEVLVTFEYAMYGDDADGRNGERRRYVKNWDIVSIHDVDSGEDVTDKYEREFGVRDEIDAELAV